MVESWIGASPCTPNSPELLTPLSANRYTQDKRGEPRISEADPFQSSKKTIQPFNDSTNQLPRRGQLHQHLPVAGLHAGQLTVPAFDQGALVFELAKLQQLRRDGGLTDAVGLRFTLSARHAGLGFTLGCGDLLGGFGLRLGQLVART